MFENPNLMPSKRTEHPRVKTAAELTEELRRRKKLRMEYQKSFLDVARLFGPTVHTVITNRHRERDIRLTAEADKAVVARMVNRGSGTSDAHVELNIQLELQTLLYTEYRDSYFAMINLLGGDIFHFVRDNHHQRDGVFEAESAQIDNMIEKIWNVAD